MICCDAMVSCDGNEYDIYWDVIHGILMGFDRI